MIIRYEGIDSLVVDFPAIPFNNSNINPKTSVQFTSYVFSLNVLLRNNKARLGIMPIPATDKNGNPESHPGMFRWVIPIQQSVRIANNLNANLEKYEQDFLVS